METTKGQSACMALYSIDRIKDRSLLLIQRGTSGLIILPCGEQSSILSRAEQWIKSGGSAFERRVER